MQLWVLLMTALVPLAIAPGLLSAFDITPKIAILLVSDSALLLFCKNFVNGIRSLFASTWGRLFVTCLAFEFLSSLASTLWSTNPRLSEVGSSWRRDGLIAESAILLFALIAAAWFVEDRSRIRIVLRTAVVTGLAASLYGISQYFGWDPFLPSQGYQAGEGVFTIVRPPATFGHADFFANWLVMVVFFALALARQEEDAFWKTTAQATIALASVAIILSGTRSALLGLLIGIAVFLAVARPRFNRKAALALAAVIACLAILYVSPPGAKLRARVHWSRDDVSGGARMLLWRDSLHMAMHHPLLGYGPETFTAQFPPFQSVELARAYPDFYQESPHNMFLDALVSRGIPGVIILLALCLLAWRSSIDSNTDGTAMRKHADRSDASAPLLAALAAAIVCQQFTVLTIPTALYFYLLLAIIVAGTVPPLAPKKFPQVLIPLAAIIAIVFLAFATRLILADHALALTEKHIEAANVPAAAEAYKTVQRWELTPRESDLRYSRAMTRLATTTTVFATSVAAAQQALDAAIRATETSEDRQNAWYNYATIAALRNDPAGVENGLRRAIERAPNWFKPHWTLAQLLELTGRHAEARHEVSIAMDLDGGHDPEVMATYQKIMSRP